ncbi:hypothetical protein EVAR_87585_1 [Eumeta japonica]|uniref:Uncharacterized protein n=1 Tax=Eumeta variegata TaxID=151549 RepID=A0A4C1WMW5_EUMVA|nr:hypothetical protein EVAR_87585_1 [Eumeta japonica]
MNSVFTRADIAIGRFHCAMRRRAAIVPPRAPPVNVIRGARAGGGRAFDGNIHHMLSVKALCARAASDRLMTEHGLMMEPEGKHRNSIMKPRILAVFGFVEIVLRCTLTMNDFQDLMMQPKGRH